nr:MAG TPA: hypothetical protein [Caudoviricetes sp.]
MAEIIIIRESDLDNNTIKVVDNKVTAPGAVFKVLDKYPTPVDTDTHYAVNKHQYLQHVETGAIMEATYFEMKERPAPQQERFLDTPVTEVNTVADNFIIKAVSAIDGYKYNEVVGTFNRADYTNAKDFNEKHAGQKLTFTTPERFSGNAEPGKVLPTTVEVDYPQLPYKEGTEKATLNVVNGDPDLRINYDDPAIGNDAYGITKTVHYKLYDYSGKVYEGTKTFTGNSVTGETLADDIDYVKTNIWKVEYAVDPFHISSFFGDVTVASQAITQEIGDHL